MAIYFLTINFGANDFFTFFTIDHTKSRFRSIHLPTVKVSVDAVYLPIWISLRNKVGGYPQCNKHEHGKKLFRKREAGK